ncbi:MAG: NAD-dependent DNA ligase LigA [Bacteroidia bacterium]|nr:NAD-dependent DNA ligase LigA [Bacteroidia bacterium]MDW8345734.1 NAD-dependent DNA ligase LigA [Bacteroidia bacterium]
MATNDLIQKKIQDLAALIHEHNYRYYVLNDPIISDQEFDLLLKELITLEKQYPEFILPDSPTQRVGSDITKKFPTIEHEVQMLSLDNTYSIQEVVEFDERVQKGLEGNKYEYTCELKIDGLAISLVYENGNLLYAATRGDGKIGEVVTNNVKTIKTIPLRLQGDVIPSFVEVRGEVYISKTNFEKINEERIKQGEEIYANPRNFASGSLKLQDPREVARRKLDFFPYFVRLKEDEKKLTISTQYEGFTWLKKWGFKVNPHVQLCTSLNEVQTYLQEWETKRFTLDYETDGVVVKINSYAQQNILGNTSKFPRWAFAYKYAAQKAETVLESISFQVGRTGVITPVANLKPVLLAGTTVKRATLHNAQEIKRLDLRIGDSVLVEKGGEIIPKIVQVNLSKRPTNAQPFEFISHCPECNTALQISQTRIHYYCPNTYHCRPQIIGRVIHFVRRNAMDIQAIGEEKVAQFYDAGLIRNPADLYKITEDDLLKLDRFGKKLAENVLNGIQKSKTQPFERVLFALGIRYVGETVAVKLAYHFKSIDALFSATIEQISQIHEIGEKIAQAVVEASKDPYYIQLVAALKQAGLQFSIDENKTTQKITSNKLEGLTLLATGKMKHFTREGIEKAIRDNGGKVATSVTKKLSYLIVGDEPGESKIKKANELNIKMISEQEFLDMIKD